MSWFSIVGNEIAITDRFTEFGDFASDFAAIPAGPVKVRLNCCGGLISVADAAAAILQNHAHAVGLTIESAVASSAVAVVLAADHVSIRKNALISLHEPTHEVEGNAARLREAAASLDVITARWSRDLAARCKIPVSIAHAMIVRETTLTAVECVAIGLADEIIEPGPPPPQWALDLLAARGKGESR
jgi:ATP-dependent Clp protease, protease subunit